MITGIVKYPHHGKTIRFIRLRQNTLQLAAGMNGGANAPKLEQRPSSAVALLRRMERRVGFCEFRFDTPQLAAGRFIVPTIRLNRGCPQLAPYSYKSGFSTEVFQLSAFNPSFTFQLSPVLDLIRSSDGIHLSVIQLQFPN